MRLRKEWIAVIIAVLIVLAGILVIDQVATGQDSKEKQLVEDALRKAILTCYAIEEKYPPSIDYLRLNYNLSYDESRFQVIYENSGMDNVFPVYRVLDRRDYEGNSSRSVSK